MKKLFIISIIISVLLISSLTTAEEVKIVEFLGLYIVPDITPLTDYIYKFVPNDVTQRETFISDTFLSFQVPASPKSDGIKLDYYVLANYKWSTHFNRRAIHKIRFNVVSNVIPINVEIYYHSMIYGWIGTNNAGDYSYSRAMKRHFSHIRRNNLCNWQVKYKSSGDYVPEDQAFEILNNLIDRGFSIEIQTEGEMQGMERYTLWHIKVELLRITKK